MKTSRKRNIGKFGFKQIPNYLSVTLGDAIRWNGAKYWNYVVQISDNYLLTRRCSKWGWKYCLVSRRKNPTTTDLFGEVRLQYEPLVAEGLFGCDLTDNNFLQIVEEKKPFEEWLMPSSYHIHSLSIFWIKNKEN